MAIWPRGQVAKEIRRAGAPPRPHPHPDPRPVGAHGGAPRPRPAPSGSVAMIRPTRPAWARWRAPG